MCCGVVWCGVVYFVVCGFGVMCRCVFHPVWCGVIFVSVWYVCVVVTCVCLWRVNCCVCCDVCWNYVSVGCHRLG